MLLKYEHVVAFVIVWEHESVTSINANSLSVLTRFQMQLSTLNGDVSWISSCLLKNCLAALLLDDATMSLSVVFQTFCFGLV